MTFSHSIKPKYISKGIGNIKTPSVKGLTQVYLFAFLPEVSLQYISIRGIAESKIKDITLLNLAKIFFIIATSFCISTNSMWEHLFPHKLVDQRTCCQIGTFVSLIKWNLLVSICLLLVGNKVEKLFLCLRIISPLFMNCYLSL